MEKTEFELTLHKDNHDRRIFFRRDFTIAYIKTNRRNLLPDSVLHRALSESSRYYLNPP